MSPKVILEAVSGPIQGQAFSFDHHDVLLFGRDTDCGARIENDSKASRHHFLVEVNPPEARLRDLGSRNGTIVNGVKHGGRRKSERPEDVAGREYPEVDLKSGDRISVGGTTIVVRIEAPRQCLQCGAELPEVSSDQAAPSDIPDGVPVTVTEVAPGISKESVCENCRNKPGGLRGLLQEAAKRGEGRSPFVPRSSDRNLPAQKVAKDEKVPELDGYDVGAELGRGGMGVVYRAVRKADRLNVAVKLMLAKFEVCQEARKKFQREIDVIRKLEHPNLVKMLDTGAIGAGFYFVMEFCNAGSLDRLIAAQGGKLRLGIAAQVFRQCLRGLEHSHRKALVHRDLKPQNVLLHKEGGKYCVKIADFGLAKNSASAGLSGMTATGSYAGTYCYMPREQLTQFKYVWPASDVWSMAATFYNMLTGALPLDFPRNRDPVRVILDDKPIPIRKRDRTIPPALAAVIDRALAVDPAARYQTASELKAAFKQVI